MPQATVLFLIWKNNETRQRYAVQVKTEYNQLLGYVPAFYSEFISSMLKKHTTYRLNVLHLDKQAIPQLSVRVALRAPMNDESLSLSTSVCKNVSPISI